MTAITTAQAAEAVGMDPAPFRAMMTKLRQRGGPDLRLPADQWPDKRTPLYDAEAVAEWNATRRTWNR